MKEIRTAADIFGLWAAIPMTWTSAGRLDAGKLKRNVERLANVPCDGIYSTDSDGEFYALEIEEFRQFIGVFSRCLEPTQCGVQVGVTWTNTQGIIERIKVCLNHGISAVHICYPYWMPLNQSDVERFWETLANEVPEARWVHYNTPRGHFLMNGNRYRRLADQYPEQFIGTKLGTQNYLELSEIIGATPEIAHVVTDYVVAPGMMLGARGTYSFWVNTLPSWQRRFIDLCMAGQWTEATSMQAKFNRWEVQCIEPLVKQGYLHGIVGKARCATTGFLEDDGHTKAPYSPVQSNNIENLRNAFKEWWPDELAEENFGRAS